MQLSVHQIQDAENLPFSKKEYSLFKFGSKSIARRYGLELFTAFTHYFVDSKYDKDDTQIVVCSSPYNHIPTATNAMKDYFVEYLNTWLVHKGYPVVQQTKIHRYTSYTDDYGALSAEQRRALIGGDQFHVDIDFLEDKLVLLLDDIRITGTHEKMIVEMLRRYMPNAYKEEIEEYCTPWFLYYAVLSNDQIDPSIENVLNYASIKGLLSVMNMIMVNDFIFNTRVIKYMLSYDNLEFTIAVENWKVWKGLPMLENLYHLAIGNSYHLVPEYKENLEVLKNVVHESV